MRMTTMDAIGLTAFGHNFGCIENASKGQPEAMTAFEYLLSEHTRRLSSPWPWDQYYSFPTWSNYKHWLCRNIVRRPINTIIKNRREQQRLKSEQGTVEPAEEEEDPSDFLSLMLTARDDEGTAFTDEDLSDELVTLMFAGLLTHMQIRNRL